MRLLFGSALTWFCLELSVIGIDQESAWVGDEYDNALGVEPPGSFNRSPFKLRTPDFTPHHKPVIDYRSEMEHWDDVSARLRVQLKADPEASNLQMKNYGEVLRRDVASAEKMNRKIQAINAHIQAESFIRPDGYGDYSSGFSLLQLSDDGVLSDWNYCMCPLGPNGTMVFPERDWPGVVLPTLPPIHVPSFLQVNIKGREAIIKTDPNCNCSNPWEGFNDPSESSQCSRTYNATICVVHVNKGKGLKDRNQIEEDIVTLLAAIDQSYMGSVNSTGSTLEVPLENISISNSSHISEKTATNASDASQANTSIPVEVSPIVASSNSSNSDLPKNTTSNGSPNSTAPSSNGSEGSSNITSGSFAEIWKPFRFQL